MNFVTPTAPDPVARARELGPAIEAAADAIERTQRIPEPLLSQLHAARLCRMLLPRSVDGDEVEPWVYLRAIEEISRHDGSVGWNMFVANSSALIAPFLPPESMRTIFADPRAVVAWGPPNESKAIAVPGGYRVTGQWSFASGCRQATWMGAHCHVVEPDGSLRLNAAGRPTVRTLLCPVAQATLLDDTWNVIGMRGTHVGVLSARRRVRARGIQRHARGSRRCGASRAGCTPIRCRASMPWAWPASRSASRARCSMPSRTWRPARPRAISARLADNAVVQSNVAQMEARLGAARAYLVETLSEHLGGRRSVGDRRAGAGARAAGLRVRHPDGRGGGGLRLQGGRDAMRSSSAPRSSGGSATSTRCRSRSSRAPRISNRSARSCSASNRQGRSCRRVRRRKRCSNGRGTIS